MSWVPLEKLFPSYHFHFNFFLQGIISTNIYFNFNLIIMIYISRVGMIIIIYFIRIIYTTPCLTS
ncbi:hypothetical protein HanPI659440_Chr15g0597481 [Helianthus annuus]|nr:hypothetical protein HanIR_Chr15g0757541 [Helianthus annuus]KAJ0693466.1 hypothetical protein HanPI659440_Chr15g0597481 [Helianthus annuus]